MCACTLMNTDNGTTEEEHLQNLDTVLTRLETAGMRLKRNKCAFYLQLLSTWGTEFWLKGYSLQIRRSEQSIMLQHQATSHN